MDGRGVYPLLAGLFVLACVDGPVAPSPTPVTRLVVEECPVIPIGADPDSVLSPGGGDCEEDPFDHFPGYYIPQTRSSIVGCTTAAIWDNDHDGFDDVCEFGLAVLFAPQLIFSYVEDCIYDGALDRLGGEYYFAFGRPTGNSTSPKLLNSFDDGLTYRIVYMPAYYADCGVPDSENLPQAGVNGLSSHVGDSEFIIIDIRYDTFSHHWITLSSFYSAHCGVEDIDLDENCQEWSIHDLLWVDKDQGAPKAFVSIGKHANYPNAATCTKTFDVASTTFVYERCVALTHHRAEMRFPLISHSQNVGSREYPFPYNVHSVGSCVPVLSGSSLPTIPSYGECFWEGIASVFLGWMIQGSMGFDGDPAGPYWSHLEVYADF